MWIARCNSRIAHDLRDLVNLLAPVLTNRQREQLEEDALHLTPLLLGLARPVV